MLPTRERIVRKAKEKACESLHEITSGYHKSNANTSSTSTSVNNSTINTTKRNNRSYKPFPEQNQQSDDELSDQNETETPKKTTRIRRKANPNQQRTMNRTTKPAKGGVTILASKDTELNENDNTSSLLFSQIYIGQASLQSIVDDWIELYKKDKETAMLDIIKFIVRSSGCKSAHLLTNNKEILRTKEFTDSINDLIENFNDDDDTSGETYPLVQNSVQSRKFKSNFSEFLQLLISQCQYSIIYDQYMLDILITFLIALADSQVRAFRHTATLAVLKIMTALVDVLLALSISKDACQRQYDNERQKSQVKRANDRIEMLINKRKEVEENEYEIQNFINFIFKAVFIHRYRDICADIRCVCINEIGEWMLKCPNKFLDDTFLKYIGWTLYDKTGECRLKCLQALHPLYEQDDLLSRLELFTSRFKNRIVEMSLDKEHEVSVSAIKLLTCVVTKNDAALEDKDCENIYELVYHANRHIAQAAGEFLNQKLFVKIENPQIEFKRGKKQSENSAFIQLLVQFLTESELHDHPTYLVDAMWDIHPMLKDWECMTDLLLEDPLNPEDALDDQQERYIIEILTCCVKQAATGEYPIARRAQTTARKLTAKENKQVQDDKVILTQHFITTIPLLLTKYIADAEKLVYLLQIPMYFDLTQYTLRRQEKNLEKLLKLLQDIVSKHNDSNVLEECSKCLSYMCDEENAIYIKCNLMRSTILDELVNSFNNTVRNLKEKEEVDENEMFPLTIALKRLSAFAENHNISNYDFVKNALVVLKWTTTNEDFTREFVSKAISLVRSVINWNLHKLGAEIEENANANDMLSDSEIQQQQEANVNKGLIEFIAKLCEKFFKNVNNLFVSDNLQIQEEAYFELCDLLILFNMHLPQQHKEFKSLVMDCQLNDINMLSVFVMDNAFTPDVLNEKADTTDSIVKLHKRRCILTSFCKLIAYNCVPVKYAAEIFRGYIKYNSSYGDIIKHLLSTCREISKVNTAKTIVLALQREYIEAVQTFANRTTSEANSSQSSVVSSNRIDRSSPEFAALKDLTHRFCLSFGPEASTKSREAIITIHQEALKYVNEPSSTVKQTVTNQVAPPNLPFLEVIVEFSTRLTAQDKRIMLSELDKSFAKRANKIESNHWQPYYTYRLSLMEDHSSTTTATANVNINSTTNGITEAINQNSTTVKSTSANTSNVNNLTGNHNSTSNAAPSAVGSSSGSINNTSSSAEGDKNRKRKPNNSINVSGISTLKDTLNTERTKQVTNRIPELNEDDENNGYENEEDDENIEQHFNDHADSTTNELNNLKLSTINPPDTNARTRVTRSKVQQQPILNNNQNTTNNKRSRSPLVTNNTINESLDMQNSVLTSTRIEPHRLTKASNLYTSAITKSSVSVASIKLKGNVNSMDEQDANNSNDQDNDEDLVSTPSKRKRRSEDPEQETAHLSQNNLRERNSNNALSVS